jgi:hypothetical protein
MTQEQHEASIKQIRFNLFLEKVKEIKSNTLICNKEDLTDPEVIFCISSGFLEDNIPNRKEYGPFFLIKDILLSLKSNEPFSCEKIISENYPCETCNLTTYLDPATTLCNANLQKDSTLCKTERCVSWIEKKQEICEENNDRMCMIYFLI